MTSPAALSRCPDCGAEVAPGLLACPGCARLTHGEELARLAREAESAEKAGDLTTALATWRRTLALLPADTLQRKAIDERMRGLSAEIDGRGPARGGARKGAGSRAAAGAGVVGVVLLKSKALLLLLLGNAKLLLLGLLKLPTLISALIFFRFSSLTSLRWFSPWDVKLVGGIVACIYVHEMGHVAALRRYGIDASAPMFVPGFGAVVRLRQYPTDAAEDARTGLAGPLWGLVASAVAVGLGGVFGWPSAITVGSISASINLFNLIPVWQLDGSRGWRALSRFERAMVVATAAVVGLVLNQWAQWAALTLAVAGGVRMFSDARSTSAAAPQPAGDRGVFWLFVFLLVALGALAMFPIRT